MRKFTIFAALLIVVLFVFSLIVIRGEKRNGNTNNSVKPSSSPAEETSAVSPEPAASPEVSEEKKSEISSIMQNTFSSVSGTCNWGVYTFDDGTYTGNTSAAVPSASVIKLFIMEYTFSRIENGTLNLTGTIEGSSVKTLLENMITVSDNSATNVFIDYYGMSALNAFFKERGYNDTSLQRRMLDYDAMAAGRENYTSVSDVMRFLQKLYNNREKFPCKDMLDIMKRQKVRTKIPRNLPADVTVAHKTGELDTVENDVGIVYTEDGDFAIVCLCSNLADRETARNAISNAASRLYEFVKTDE